MKSALWQVVGLEPTCSWLGSLRSKRFRRAKSEERGSRHFAHAKNGARAKIGVSPARAKCRKSRSSLFAPRKRLLRRLLARVLQICCPGNDSAENLQKSFVLQLLDRWYCTWQGLRIFIWQNLNSNNSKFQLTRKEKHFWLLVSITIVDVISSRHMVTLSMTDIF